MDEVDNVIPVKPMRCPRCGKKIIFEPNDTMRCPDCGELYYDQWLGIFRIKPYEVNED